MTYQQSEIDAYKSGSDQADFGKAIANVAREAVCGIFQQFPGALVPSAGDNPVRGVWLGLCKNSNAGLPAAPTSPFTGGQCPLHRYNVHINVRLSSGTVVPTDTTVYGPVNGISLNSGFDSFGAALGFNIDAKDFTGAPTIFHTAIGGGAPADGISAIAVTPNDGLPDTCGDPAPQYPTATIPTADLTSTQTITQLDGSTATLTAIIPVPPTGTNSLPTVNILSPTASIIGAINVSVDIGGIHLGSNADLANLQSQIADLQTKTNAIAKNTAPPPKKTDSGVTATAKPSTTRNNTGISNLAFVEITITSGPTRASIQGGDSGSPDVIHGGWFSFTSQGVAQGRFPICYKSMIFYNEDKLDGYAFTFTNGCEGFPTEYTLS